MTDRIIEVQCPRPGCGTVEIVMYDGRANAPEEHAFDPALTDEPSHPFTFSERLRMEERAEEIDLAGARSEAIDRGWK